MRTLPPRPDDHPGPPALQRPVMTSPGMASLRDGVLALVIFVAVVLALTHFGF